MSKTQLKKFLKDLTAEQLQEVIIDAYLANAETKRYFDFFLNPDVDKEKEKAMLAIYKKFYRHDGSYVKRPKIKATNSIVKDFITLVTEPRAGADIMIYQLEMLLEYANSYYCTSSLVRSIGACMSRLARFLVSHSLEDDYYKQTEHLLSQTTTLPYNGHNIALESISPLL